MGTLHGGRLTAHEIGDMGNDCDHPKVTRPANLANAWDQLWDERLQDGVQLDAMGLIPSDRYMILCKARYYVYLLYPMWIYDTLWKISIDMIQHRYNY